MALTLNGLQQYLRYNIANVLLDRVEDSTRSEHKQENHGKLPEKAKYKTTPKRHQLDTSARNVYRKWLI